MHNASEILLQTRYTTRIAQKQTKLQIELAHNCKEEATDCDTQQKDPATFACPPERHDIVASDLLPPQKEENA